MDSIIIYGIATLLAIIGFYFAIKAFISFTNMSDDVLRAKIFLSKNFLHDNFVVIFIMGIFVSLHTILEFIEYSLISVPFMPTLNILYAISLPISTFSMAFLAYQWNSAMFQKKR
ncbi:MAG: hypothetical protein PHU34_11515 [Candidatus Methanoperedens sp.]|nr:hypothetical protein [Candidatus Methanoperedens sp.]